MILYIWTIGGLVLVIMDHKNTERQRNKLYDSARSQMPHLSPDFAMRLANACVIISLVVFLITWPFIFGFKLLKSIVT